MTIEQFPTRISQRNAKRLQTRKMVGVSALSASIILGVLSVSAMPAAFAAEPKVGLGTTESYSVLGGQTVTNTGTSILSSDLGVSPGTAITGFPPGIVLGTVHAADAVASQAQSDLVIAYDDAAGRAPTASVAGDLVGQTLPGGVYKSTGPLAVSGTLTLDAQNDPNTVFVFQVASTLTTASASNVSLVNGAQACNVYWQVGSSATLGTASTFKGSILALTSITATTDATVEGRALARNGAVTLDNNVFTAPGCLTSIPTVPPTTTAPATTQPATTAPATTAPATTPPATSTPTATIPAATTPATIPAVTPPAITPPGTATLTSTATVPVSTNPAETTPAITETTDTGIGMAEATDTETSSSESTRKGELARTGASFNILTLGAGLMMLVLGGLFMVGTRKPANSRRH